eukprot:1151953-Pelagomonas_calceolata.AAC.6
MQAGISGNGGIAKIQAAEPRTLPASGSIGAQMRTTELDYGLAIVCAVATLHATGEIGAPPVLLIHGYGRFMLKTPAALEALRAGP